MCVCVQIHIWNLCTSSVQYVCKYVLKQHGHNLVVIPLLTLHRLQRLSLVENETFHQRLIDAVISETSSDHVRHRALDLLLWITSIHTAASMLFLPYV